MTFFSSCECACSHGVSACCAPSQLQKDQARHGTSSGSSPRGRADEPCFAAPAVSYIRREQNVTHLKPHLHPLHRCTSVRVGLSGSPAGLRAAIT